MRSPSTGNTAECRIPWLPSSSHNVSMLCYTFWNIDQHSSPVIHPVQSLHVYRSCESQQSFQNNELYLAFLFPNLSKDTLLKLHRELWQNFSIPHNFCKVVGHSLPDRTLAEDKLSWKINYCSISFSFSERYISLHALSLNYSIW